VVIGSAIVSALDKLDLQFPKVGAAELAEFRKVQAALENEGKKPAAKKVGAKKLAKS
jgi:hypothetical protein